MVGAQCMVCAIAETEAEVMKTALDLLLHGRVPSKSVVASVHPAGDLYSRPAGLGKSAGLSSKEQVLEDKKNALTPAEQCLVREYMNGARSSEEEIGDAALRKLVHSPTFMRFVHRLELENEVVELHKQLDKEVELHSALERALSNLSSTQLPNPDLHHLPSNVQQLLTDIAMLEVAVLRLEMQASALQSDLAHERTERAVVHQTLNSPSDVPSPVEDAKSLPALSLAHQRSSYDSPQCPVPSKVPSRFVTCSSRCSNSPARATLKDLLRKPSQESSQQFRTPPKSPRQALRLLWSPLDGQSQMSFLPFSKKTASPSTAEKNPRTSQDEGASAPSSESASSNPTSSASLSPFTPGEEPQNTTPVTPTGQPDHPVVRKSLNPVKLFPSAKRLAFWNFSSFSEERSVKPAFDTEAASVSLPRDCPSRIDEVLTDDVRIRKLRRIWRMRLPEQSQSPRSPLDNAPTAASPPSISNQSDASLQESPRSSCKESPRQSKAEKLEIISYANRLSEEMVRCMANIYCHLAGPSSQSHGSQDWPASSCRTDRLSPSSSNSSQSDSFVPSGARSPSLDTGLFAELIGCDSTPDPYKVSGKLPWADIGPYANAYEVLWLTVGMDQLECVAQSLGRFRILVEQLSQVNPSAMTHEQKLAFWINLYNALLMHAFLAYGIPRSDLKFFTLMQKAAYCVGGHWFNAAAIECHLLKARIMLHRPQFALIMALHSKKLTEEQSEYGIGKPDPKVNFALSCGGHSSPMVRIYTAEHVHDQLDCALRDYARATVGLTSKGRVLLPKLLYNYAREFVEDDVVPQWVTQFLPAPQAAAVYECTQQRYRRRIFNNPATFSVSPFSFAFRYLFPESFSCPDG
nr:uncharacterized protein LOC112291191 isoform X3 [Physcomitrium patens]|eukprot:XP_024394065.1 uncharacterized protein LOC112291191 isoform X3 [Physcomitrella patens]